MWFSWMIVLEQCREKSTPVPQYSGVWEHVRACRWRKRACVTASPLPVCRVVGYGPSASMASGVMAALLPTWVSLIAPEQMPTRGYCLRVYLGVILPAVAWRRST